MYARTHIYMCIYAYHSGGLTAALPMGWQRRPAPPGRCLLSSPSHAAKRLGLPAASLSHERAGSTAGEAGARRRDVELSSPPPKPASQTRTRSPDLGGTSAGPRSSLTSRTAPLDLKSSSRPATENRTQT